MDLLRRVAAEDGGPDSSSKSDGLVAVDRSVPLLAIEEVTDELLDARNTGRDCRRGLVDLRVLRHLSTDSIVKRKRSWQSSAKRQRVMVVQKQDTFEERVDFDGRLGDRECSLRTFASRAEM